MAEEQGKTTPPPQDTKLSVVSKQYDRGEKGYLDETEQQLRIMDSQNLGHLDQNKVYSLMQDFQKEQQKAVTLKRIVIALACFSVLLALANIGTSFAAAKLAQDSRVTDTGDFVALSSGLRVGVNSRDEIFALDGEYVPPPFAGNESQRLLQNNNAGDIGLGGDGNQGTRSPLTISKNKVDRMYNQMCGSWPGVRNWKCDRNLQCSSSSPTYITYACNNAEPRVELTYHSKPQCSNNPNVVTFKFNARQDGQSIGVIDLRCDLTDPKEPCAVSGLGCPTNCAVCITYDGITPSGGVERWVCDDPVHGNNECGCEPGQCFYFPQACTQECYWPPQYPRPKSCCVYMLGGGVESWECDGRYNGGNNECSCTPGQCARFPQISCNTECYN